MVDSQQHDSAVVASRAGCLGSERRPRGSLVPERYLEDEQLLAGDGCGRGWVT